MILKKDLMALKKDLRVIGECQGSCHLSHSLGRHF